MRKSLWILLPVSFIVFVCTTGKLPDKWEWRAGDYALQGKYQNTGYACRHKVRDLGAEMKTAGADFKVAIGTRCLEPHCWIIYKDKILEPTAVSETPDLYKTDRVMTYDEFLDMWKKLKWD